MKTGSINEQVTDLLQTVTFYNTYITALIIHIPLTHVVMEIDTIGTFNVTKAVYEQWFQVSRAQPFAIQ